MANRYKEVMTKGYMKKCNGLWNRVLSVKHMDSQMDGNLSGKMNDPAPLKGDEIAELKSKGFHIKGGYVTSTPLS